MAFYANSYQLDYSTGADSRHARIDESLRSACADNEYATAMSTSAEQPDYPESLSRHICRRQRISRVEFHIGFSCKHPIKEQPYPQFAYTIFTASIGDQFKWNGCNCGINFEVKNLTNKFYFPASAGRIRPRYFVTTLTASL